MKAIIRTKAGKAFSAMQVLEIVSPQPKQGEVKIKMKASRINPVDMDLMKGFPSLKYKTPQIGGIDGAGEIIDLGEAVTDFQVGHKVFFYRKFSDIGTWAEEIIVPTSYIAKIPKHITLEQAGSIALPILTAYEALLSLQPKSGKHILTHGAGGGVGFQAVQIAKALGLKVIANASERDKAKLEQLGIYQFINYKTTPFSDVLKDSPPQYIFDVIGKQTLKDSIILKPKKVVSVAFPDTSKMHKTGVKLPGILKFLMKLINKKFEKLAKKHQVELIGQITGPNAQLLSEVSELATKHQFMVCDAKTITLSEIESRGLNKTDLGKVILF